jgi:hypothetical protein
MMLQQLPEACMHKSVPEQLHRHQNNKDHAAPLTRCNVAFLLGPYEHAAASYLATVI